MRFVDLGLKMGDVMQLQLSADSEARYPVKLLGFIPDTSVIISAPFSGDEKYVFVREQQMVTLRFVVNSVASGFSAKVIHSRSTPKPYIHLEMPSQVQAVEVRNSARVSTEINATLVNETRKSPTLSVTLNNLSAAGGRFETPQKVALINDEFTMHLDIKLDDVERIVSIKGIVRNKGIVKPGEDDKKLTDDETINWYGFSFDVPKEEDKILLKGFVYQEILRSLHML